MKNLMRNLGLICAAFSFSAHVLANESARLVFSDGRPDAVGVSAINEVLKAVGVRLNQVEVPKASIPLLQKSLKTKLTDEDKAQVLKVFELSRKQMVSLTKSSGRDPVLPDGGSMSSGEVGVAPYPKVYDLSAMSPQDRLGARNKFAKLHVNFADGQVGVDEVMTLPSGGPWTWYFQLKDQVAVKLEMGKVEPGARAWRLIYPGLTPHGAYFHADNGLCIAYITGPKTWQMRYEAPGLAQADLLGKNPWVNFDSK